MTQQINLFNPVFLRKKKYFSAVTMVQALGLVAAGTLAFAGYATYKAQELAKISAESDRQLAASRTQLAALAKELSPQGSGGALADEMARTEGRLKGRRDLLTSLRTGDLGNVEGFSKYLAAFARQRVDGLWLTGISVGGDENDLVLRGRVLRPEIVTAYLRALNNEPVMRGRRVTELSLSASQEPGGVVPPGTPSAAPSGPGAPKSAAASAPHAPTRYVEFSLIAPRTEGPRGPAQPADQKGARS
jgi:hypothetical protein